MISYFYVTYPVVTSFEIKKKNYLTLMRLNTHLNNFFHKWIKTRHYDIYKTPINKSLFYFISG